MNLASCVDPLHESRPPLIPGGICGTVPLSQEHHFASLLNDNASLLKLVAVPCDANVAFEAAGIMFQARLVPQNDGSNQLVIWGELGYLPYSVTASTKRTNLITILEGARSLSKVQFGVDRHMKILVKGCYRIDTPPLPDYLFVPLIQFLQESLPMIRLIGENL